MTGERPSPRKVAIAAVLKVSSRRAASKIKPSTWERVINAAWDDRSLTSDRRGLRRQLDAILRDGEEADS